MRSVPTVLLFLTDIALQHQIAHYKLNDFQGFTQYAIRFTFPAGANTSTQREVCKMRFKWILALCVAVLAALPAVEVPAQSASGMVTLLHFSDYHSHAVPFYSEGAPNQAGIARGIGYLKARKAADPNVVILSGGDTMNKGTPTWSDEYQCAEWPWFNGLLD